MQYACYVVQEELTKKLLLALLTWNLAAWHKGPIIPLFEILRRPIRECFISQAIHYVSFRCSCKFSVCMYVLRM